MGLRGAGVVLEGIQFGSYEVVRPIAEGGMAQVYLGVRRGAGGFEKTVVLKVLHSRYLGDPDFVRMFLDEARILSRIRHPNVVDVFDVQSVGGVAYLAMEYVDGPTLHDLHKASLASGHVDPGCFLLLIRQVCEGLAAVHELHIDGVPAQVVHRDVSSQNVLVRAATGTAKIIDFGIARAEGALHTNTQPGIVKGKLQYIAPEVLEGEPYDARADVYAVGVLLYRIFAGRMPYRDADIASGVVRRPHVPIGHVPGLPAGLADVIERAMALDPAQRVPCAAALAEEISRIAAAIGADPSRIPRWITALFPGGEGDWSRLSESPGATGVHTSLRRLAVRPARRRAWGLGAVVLALLAAGGAVFPQGDPRFDEVRTYLDAADDLLRSGHADAAAALNRRASALEPADADLIVRVARQRVRIDEQRERVPR